MTERSIMLGERGESQGDGAPAQSSQSQASYLAVLSLILVTYKSRVVLLASSAHCLSVACAVNERTR